MTQATSCPSVPVLQRLLLGHGADEESVSLEAHLLHCEKCLQTIKSLPPDDALISSLQVGRDFATLSPRSELLEKLRVRLQEMAASARGADTSTGENTHPNAPTPSAEMTGHEIVALAPPQQPDEIGRLGGYRVLKELGRGGMGAVFQAEDPKLKRLVALKVMLPRLSVDASARRRFLREAQAMAAVHHDHVVTIYQVDEDNGVPFLAMEFLHGMPLDKWLKDGRKPSLAQILRMGREIAEGLAAAHARGLIHRDIKPGNIWLDSDHKDRVKILDFGLARVGTDDVHLTHSGAIVGTPAYMSPEQGAGQKVDARTDLFSLGSILYRFCTGAMPFSGDTTMALLTNLAIADPKPVRELNPDTPPALADLVMRLLAKKPADRPASSQEVADQLAAINIAPVERAAGFIPAGLPSPAGINPAARPASTAKKRRPWVYAGVAAGFLATAITVATVIIIRDKNGNKVGEVSVPPGGSALFVDEAKKGVDDAKKDGSTVAPFPPLDEAWAKKVRDLPAEKQVEEVAAELKRRNPGFDGKMTPRIENGVEVTGLEFLTDEVTDVTPVRALPELESLNFGEVDRWKGHFSDLSPLKGMKLTFLDCGGTQITDLSPLKGMPLTHLRCYNPQISDLSPLKGMKLTFLDCGGTQITDLSPLKDMKLTHLGCFNMPVSDLSPLKGLPLTELTCRQMPVSDLSPLKDMKLTFLDCINTRVSDLSPLNGMPLTQLQCNGTRVSDLSPLKGMKLTYLGCDSTRVSDLSPLKGMPLTQLQCNFTRVSDLSPLKDMKLTYFHGEQTAVTDLSLLKGMPLKDLVCDFKPERDTEILHSIKTLETINGKPAAEFWKDVAAKPTFPPLDEAWAKKVRDLPSEKQVEEVAAELKRRNPGFDGKMTPTIDAGEVTGLRFVSDGVTDISPVRALSGLDELWCNAKEQSSLLSDLSPLKNMKLTSFVCQSTAVSDLSPLKDMKLNYLNCAQTRVRSLAPLKGMPLISLDCSLTAVSDLSPLTGMELDALNINSTRVTDLSPLNGMKLRTLQCCAIGVSDLSPLKGMPLIGLFCQGTKVSDLSPLKGMPLSEFDCKDTHVSDLSPLKGMKLWQLQCGGTKVSDLSLLKEMPLKILSCDFVPERDTEILRSIKTLETINNKPAAEFWKEVAAKPTFPPLDEAWAKKLRELPADKQVEEVAAELKRRNPGFDGKVTPSISINSVAGLVVPTEDVTDLTPLRALAQLENLEVRPSGAAKSRLSDLSTIKDLKLTALNCNATLVSDLSPLKDMKLTVLECLATPVHDLTPLKGMPLLKLDCNNTLVSDLSPLKDMKLNELKFSGTRVTDLSVLRGLPLTILECGNLPISDLSPLKDMKLTSLMCSGTRISDLSPLKNMKLTELNCTDSPVSDLSPLKDMKLTILLCNGTHVSDLSPLQGMELGQLAFSSTPVADLSPLKGMPVKSLTCNLTRVSDLSPLKDMKLTLLECSGTRVSDLSPLQGMPLTRLGFNLTHVSDMSPLKGMPLTFLGCDKTGVFDLSPLRGMPLESLYCHDSAVTDLSPLQGINLTLLWCSGTKVTNLSPLKGMPLKDLKCDFKPHRDTETLRSIKTLETINGKPAAEFWKDVDAKPAEKKP